MHQTCEDFHDYLRSVAGIGVKKEKVTKYLISTVANNDVYYMKCMDIKARRAQWTPVRRKAQRFDTKSQATAFAEKHLPSRVTSVIDYEVLK